MVKLKIWYVSGAFEQIDADDAQAETLVPIYAEAQTSDRVAAGELHRPDGSVAASFGPVQGRQAPADLVVCGRQGTADVMNAYGLDDYPRCVRRPGHLGLHCTLRKVSSRGGASWGDNECIPVPNGLVPRL